MVSLRIKGIGIEFHPMFFVTLVFFAWVGRLYEGLLVFSLVIAHELVHAIAARRFGASLREIRLLPVGGSACFDGIDRLSPGADAFVAAAGPGFNLALALPAVLLSLSGRGNSFLLLLAKYNLMLATFNLLPALPLDGGRIARAILTKWVGRINATRCLNRTGLALVGGLMGASVFLAACGKANYTLIFVTAYLVAVRNEEKGNEVLDWLTELHDKKRRMELPQSKPLPVRCYYVSPDALLRQLLRLSRPGNVALFKIRDGTGSQQFSEFQALAAMLDTGFHARAGDVHPDP